MKSIFKLLNIFISIVLVLIAAGVVFIAFPQFGNQALIVRSGSMAPIIDVGSVVVVRNNTNKTYNVGDVIAFRSEKKSKTVITHRVVGVEPLKDGGLTYKTKGDANENVDGWIVSQKNVLGKVDFTLPFFGKILAFAKSDIGFPIMIILPATFVILLELISISREIRKRKRSFLNRLPFGFEAFDIKVGPLTRTYQGPTFGFKILIPLLIFLLAIPSTLAFFSDSETSTGNVFQASDSFPQTCSPGQVFAIAHSEVFQGPRKDDSFITDPNRIDPNKTLGAPDWVSGTGTNFFSLGKNGTITLEFPDTIAATGSSDLRIYEATNGRPTYPLEKVQVEVSTDSASWVTLADATSEPSGDGITEYDLSSGIKFVKLLETTDFTPHTNDADGFDLDAIRGEVVCD